MVGAGRYRAVSADQAALRRMRRPKPAKLAMCERLRAVVEAKLELRWSPQQISGWLVEAFPDDPEMRVSHETIYLSLFVQSRGALRKELTRYLRSRSRHPPAAGPLGHATAKASSAAWSTSANGPPKPTTVPCPAIGKATCSCGKGMQRDRDPGRTPQPLRHARRPARRPHRRCRRRRARRQDRRAPRTAAPVAHLGPGQRDGPTRPLHRRRPACPSTSATRAAPGSAAPTRTPTVCCASTSRSAPTSPTTAQADLDAVAAELNGRPRQTLGWKTPSQALDEALR